MESDSCNEPLVSKNVPRFNTPVRVHVNHYRHRLADADGLSIKAALDAIVRADILADDSAEDIKEISESQHKVAKSEKERTVFTIEAIDETLHRMPK